MSDKDSAQNVIDAYRKRRQQNIPFLVGGLAIVLVAVGIVFLVVYLGGDGGGFALFATPTSTATETATPTATGTAPPTATASPTVTLTSTVTNTPTAASPFVYQIAENDTLAGIAERFGVDLLVLMALNNLTFDSVIRVGDEILIPNPDLELDTPTPLPTGFRGTIDYTVATGDTLESIALRFNSTVEAIMKENELENANEIFIGQVLKIPTGIATQAPTRTPRPAGTLTPGATGSPAATTAPAATTPPPATATP
jgi:LysM repeat protein